MIRTFALGVALATAATVAHAVPVTWVDWTGVVTDSTGVTVEGTLTVNSDVVGVTYHNPDAIAFAQLTPATDFWTPRSATSPYTSVGPNGIDNAPTGSDIVALRVAGPQTLTFSRAVSNIYFAFVSLNGNGYGFDRDFTLLSSGGQNIDGNGVDSCGFWGCGTSSKNVTAGEYQLVGTGEPHGALLLDGTFSTLSWRSLNAENWNGFTVGIAGIAPPPVSAVPVPAAGLLLAAALGLLALARRRA